MTLDLNFGTTSAPPLQATAEKAGVASVGGFKSGPVEKKLDNLAMRGAKRAENRIHANVGKIPGSTIFSK
jgi:hypothetical protein